MKVISYKDLLIWNKGIEIVKDIYKLTEKFPESEKYAIINQMHRSAISIPLNIAEGQARQHTKEFVQFLYIALGSLAELDTQLIIARDLEYINGDNLNGLDLKIVELRKMIRSIISKLAVRN